MTNSSEQLKIQAIIKRLTPLADRQDKVAFESGVAEAHKRYGKKLFAAAFKELVENNDWVSSVSLSWLPQDTQEEFLSQANEMVAKELIKSGLRIEDHFRVSDNGIAFSNEAARFLASTGFPTPIPGNDSLMSLGLSRSSFVHPLTEQSLSDFGGKELEPSINSWGVASLLINFAMGWIDDEPTEKARESILSSIPTVAPTVDVSRLMERSRYDDRALLRLCGLLQEAFDNSANKAKNK